MARERRHIIRGAGCGPLVNTSSRLSTSAPNGVRIAPPPPAPPGAAVDNRRGERLIHAVEQEPRALVGHPHIARRGGDGSGVSDTFEHCSLAGANSRAGLENDTDPDPCHVGTVPQEERGVWPILRISVIRQTRCSAHTIPGCEARSALRRA